MTTFPRTIGLQGDEGSVILPLLDGAVRYKFRSYQLMVYAMWRKSVNAREKDEQMNKQAFLIKFKIKYKVNIKVE